MGRLWAVSGLLLVLAVWLGSAAGVRAQEATLTVEGRIVNGTPDGGVAAGLTVALDQDAVTGLTTRNTLTDEAGRFFFDEIVFDPGALYGVSVVYQGATYARGVDLSEGSPPPILLTIYETASDSDVLSAAVVSTLLSGVDTESQTVRMLEIVMLVNSSDRTYVPGHDAAGLLRFGLPPGAIDLSVDADLLRADVVQVDRGFGLIANVPPGEHEVLYSYGFPYSGSEISFDKSLRYGAVEFRVLTPEGTVSLSSPQLEEAETVEIGGRNYNMLQASDVPPGSVISLELADLPQASLGDKVGNAFGKIRVEFAAPAGLGAFLAVLIVFGLWRRGAQERPDRL